MSRSRPVVIIAGPTGSGKSALALDLALACDGTIINADSMQMYAELRVLTARPCALDEARVPHRLYGVLPAAVRCLVGRWLQLAVPEIERAWRQRRLPIVTGGSGLYLKALTTGLSPVPPVPDALCRELEEAYGRAGGLLFRERLRALDPASAERLPASDRQRLIRALAVAQATGRPLTQWHADCPGTPPLDARFATIVLLPDREQLYRRLDARFAAMLASGAVDEVRALLQRGLDPRLPVMKAVGVPELISYLEGRSTLAAASAAASRATRRFAKRQMTWLRHQIVADLVVKASEPGCGAATTLEFVRAFLLTPDA